MAGGVMPDGALRRARGLTAELNRRCRCVTLDRAALMQTREAEADVERVEAVVRAIEAAARLPGYVEAALVRAPEFARFDPGPAGAFMGHDFHLEADGPKLIEVNTNAGGAFLNALPARARWACCGETAPGGFEDAVWGMFETEWRLQRGTGAPASIAIVDDEP